MLGVSEGIIRKNRHTEDISECGSVVCTEINGSLLFCRLQIPTTDPAKLIEGFAVQLLLHSQFWKRIFIVCLCCMHASMAVF